MKLCKKQKFLASRLQRPVAARSDIITKKIASGLFQNRSGWPEDWTVSGPCHLNSPLISILHHVTLPGKYLVLLSVKVTVVLHSL